MSGSRRAGRGDDPLASLGYGGSQLRRRHRELQDGDGAHSNTVAGSLRAGSGKEQHHRDCWVLPPRVGQQFQRLGIERVDPGDHEVDSAAFQPTNRGAVVGRLVDLVAQRLEHGTEQRQDRRLGMNDEDSGLAHEVILSGNAPAGANTGRCVILEKMNGDTPPPRSRSATGPSLPG
jgi:hypothetical protein